jgi:aspartate racemase
LEDRVHKKIGILGGLSPESTVTYYEEITRSYTAEYGDYGYPEILIYSVNFQRYVDWQRDGHWEEAAVDMVRSLAALKSAGADFGIIATNTMHRVFDQVQAAVDLPLLSIVEATASEIHKEGLAKVGLLGTVFTMEASYYPDGLARKGIEVLVPPDEDQVTINRIIYQELCRGEIREESRLLFQQIIERLHANGAGGVILGCTEIPLLVRPEDSLLPLYNTTLLHAQMALDYAVGA